MQYYPVFQVIRELASYDEPNQAPNEYIWWYDDDRWDSSVYFPAPTNAMDALMTFNVRQWHKIVSFIGPWKIWMDFR